MNGKSSSRVFAPRKERLECPQSCQTCKSAKKSNRCNVKNVVYEIICQHCDTVYVGETSRTVGSRIKEHITTKQTVHKHLLSQNNGTPTLSDINWKILRANISKHTERKYIEAFEIQNRGDKIMNGCIGRIICV